MQVSITFEVDNAIFEDRDGGGLDLSEVAGVVRWCADRIEDGDRDFGIVDRNGNTIGRCAIE